MGRLMKRIIKSSVVAATTALISNFLNLSETKVGKILGIAIPMITFFTADDPKISDLLFKNSKDRRDRGKKDGPFDLKAAEKEFFDVFGDKGHAMSKFIAKETDSTEEEVNGVLGMLGEPDLKEELKEGKEIGGVEYKVHLDGHNFAPFLT